MMPSPTIFMVLLEHGEHASFLWEQRGRAKVAPHYSLPDLVKLDQSLEAHLDGLRVAGDAGWEICKEALSTRESGEVFAASVLAFENRNQSRIETVVAAGTASQELSRGLISALGWLPFQQAEPHIQYSLASPSSSLRRVGIAASAIHRQNSGPPLIDAISNTDPVMRARALRAAGELGLTSYRYEIEQHHGDKDDRCRFWAAWSLALLGDDAAAALATLVSFTQSNVEWREKALQVALRRMDVSAANAWQNRLAQNTKQIRIAVIAAGALGDPVCIPWLIEQMSNPELARVAGEAFTMITGVDLAYQDLDGQKPEGFSAGPTEDPADENVEMDPDENLPWPTPQLIAKWWTHHHYEFQMGTRYLLGKPISTDWCQQVLRDGRQRQRAAAALELVILEPGTPLFNVAAPGFRQQQLLGLRR